jgi:hypothetical protein
MVVMVLSLTIPALLFCLSSAVLLLGADDVKRMGSDLSPSHLYGFTVVLVMLSARFTEGNGGTSSSEYM